MKQFIIRLFLFLAVFLILGTAAVLVSKRLVNNGQFYKLPSTVNGLILGHSQPECALNDSLIDNVRNLSQGGEAYFYTYQKIKKLLPENPQIKTIYISFSNNQIEKRMDEWTYDDEHLGNYFPKYAAQMDSEDYVFLLENNYKSVLSGEVKALKNNVGFLINRKKSFMENGNWGGYLFLKRNKIDSLIKINYIEQVKKELSDSVSTINVDYLEKIVTYCQSRKVAVVFFRTPVHKLVFSIYDEKKFQEVRKSRFAEIPFYDFHDFPLETSQLGDFDHLNYKGANQFSTHFNEFIKSKK